MAGCYDRDMARAPWRRLVRKLSPWVIAVAVAAVLLRSYSAETIAEWMARRESALLVPFAIGAVLWSFMAVGFADFWIARQLTDRLSAWKMMRGKAGVGVLAAISYGAGQGGYGLWIARATGVGALVSVGLVTYLMTLDLSVICALASITLWAVELPHGGEAMATFKALAPVGAVAIAVLTLAGPHLVRRFVQDPQMARIWGETRPLALAKSLSLRAMNVLGQIVMAWGAARAFGLPIPLTAFLGYLPLIFLVGSLPINVGGFGAVQAVWVYLFSGYASGEQIIAFQLLYSTLIILATIARGLPFLASVTREIDEG